MEFQDDILEKSNYVDRCNICTHESDKKEANYLL